MLTQMRWLIWRQLFKPVGNFVKKPLINQRNFCRFANAC